MLLNYDVGWGQCHTCLTNLGPQNSNLVMSNYPSPIGEESKSSFQSGYVEDWHSAYNSPHHIQIVNNECEEDLEFANGSEINCLAARQRDNYTEGIYHQITSIMIPDPTDVYSLSLDINRLPCTDPNASALIHIKLTNDLTPYPLEDGDTSSPPPVVDHQLLESVLVENNETYSVCENFIFASNLAGFYQIYIHSENILPGILSTYVNIDNVLLSCITTALDGFTTTINNLQVEFEALWNSQEQGIASYLWNFGDGNTSTSAIPIHNYTQDGYYEVCLSIINDNGCCAQECREIVVGCPTSESTFTVEENECGSFTFTPTTIRPNTTYVWSAPGGAPISGNGATFTTEYIDNGNYNVSLRAVHACGQSTTTQSVNISCLIPTCMNLLPAYLIEAEPLTPGVLLSSLLNDPISPLSHTILANGTVRVSNQYIHLVSNLLIDVRVEFINTDWFCESGTTILMQENLTLKFNHLRSCDKMWKGIKNLQNKRLFMNNCIVEDAEFGVEIKNLGLINSSRDTFINCYSGIRIPSSPTSQNIINTFTQTSFENRGGLRLPYPGQGFHAGVMYSGIWASNATQVNVQTCRFINLTYGIRTVSSSLVCSGSQFIGQGFMRGVDILENGPVARFINNNFQDLYLGIFNNSGVSVATLDIKNNNRFNKFHLNSDLVMDGIFIRGNSELVSSINNNSFTTNGGIGFISWVNHKFTISNNDFSFEGNTSITVRLNDKISTINNNNFYRLGNQGVANKSVIILDNCNNLSVNDNTFENLSGGIDAAVNIRLANVNRSTFRNNNFIGKQIAFESFVVSSWNKFCCNTSTEPGNSFLLRAPTLGDFRNNTWHTLKLDEFGEMGGQQQIGNRWQNPDDDNIGTIAEMDEGTPDKAARNRIAMHPDFPALRPSAIIPSEISQEWLFDYALISNCTNNPYCMDEGDFEEVPGGGGNDDPDPDGPNDPNPDDPTVGDPPRPELCQKVMTNYFNYINQSLDTLTPYPSQTLWMINEYLIKYIDQYGQNFFDSCIGDSTIWITLADEEWYDTEKDKHKVYTGIEPLKVYGEDLLNTAKDLSESIFVMVDSSAIEDNLPVLEVLYLQMDTVTHQLEMLSDTIRQVQHQRALSLIPTIAALPEPYVFLTFRKKVWLAEMKCYLYGKDSVTTNEWNEIRLIAAKCPAEMGRVVSEAISLLAIYMDENYNEDFTACQGVTPRSVAAVSLPQQITIYPNPSKDLLSISIPEGIETQHLEIFSMQGTLVKRFDLNGQNTQNLDVSSINAGVYTYKIIDGHQKVHTGKIVIID